MYGRSSHKIRIQVKMLFELTHIKAEGAASFLERLQEQDLEFTESYC